ncbi:hypothetical protein MKP08_00915 [Erythrobacter sp. LQ02-29]|uniref:COG3650 family protein n=1 Tax=unclassified Erythrobacter TaxID=2633097 RepID=UPI001BFC228D|nr:MULTISPECIES: hypothetical protein [unclassified Erythrobacter]MCP9221311.1 hypothetical protein [Erythrobacter sp. LQ02-29]QWC57347.1 hypothetical protein F7D01_09835 [Erythrobacter sp. 3-20A1M]
MRIFLSVLALVAVSACSSPSDEVTPDTAPQGFRGIGEAEVITFTGTEPFWGGTVRRDTLVWRTPENTMDGATGQSIDVERFYGQGGIAFSGQLDGRPFDMMVTPGACSDGMSDRTYPYTVTVKVGDRQLEGCASTDRQPATDKP